MKYLMVPLSFVLGALAGGLLVRFWRGGGADAPLRKQKLKLVVSTALATILLVGAGGYGYFRYKFRMRKVSKASMKDAVADFRKAGGSLKVREGFPAGGVYTYKAKGYLKVKSALMGNTDRPVPPTVPAVLIPKGDCWELGLRLFKGHQRTEKYCKTAKGVRLAGRWEKNIMYGIKNFSRQSTGPNPVIGPTGTPGSTWKDTWKVVEHKTDSPLPVKRPDLPFTMTYVGVETLTIGGQKVKAHHVKQHSTWTGAIGGTLKRDVWYAVDNGLMVKLWVDSRSDGLAKVTIDRKYELVSLTPNQ